MNQQRNESQSSYIKVTAGGTSLFVMPGEELIVGRDPQYRLTVEDLKVSRQHLKVSLQSGPQERAVIEDLSSSNGSFIQGQRITAHTIESGVMYPVMLGDYQSGPVIEVEYVAAQSTDVALETSIPEQDVALSTIFVPTQTGKKVTIGRGDSADIRVHDPLVSRVHCEVEYIADGLIIRDLDSVNGVSVRGSLVSQSALRAGDVFTIGNTDIEVSDSLELVVRSTATRTGLVVRDVSYETPKGDVLIRDINLNAPPNSLLGVIGPSGAGKSTLMNVVTGLRNPASGSVEFEGHDVHAERDIMKSRVGFVPQDDLIHRQLTVTQAFTYTADLRLPADTTSEEKAERVSEVVKLLGLADHKDKQIKNLSGGQRKRASIGLELLTRPALLVLDEPTSGLDPNTASELMATLHALSRDDRTILVVTHSPADLQVCDIVVLLAAGGLLAGVGSPEAVLGQYGVSEWHAVYQKVSGENGNPQKHHDEFVEASKGSLLVQPPPRPRRRDTDPSLTVKKQPQLKTLIRRQTKLLIAERGYLIFLLLMPIALGVLALAVPGSDGFIAPGATGDILKDSQRSKEASQLLVILICGAAFSGLALSIRDLVGERLIYERERAVGLRSRPYLTSKIVVFFAAGLVQAALLSGVVLLRKQAPVDPLVAGNGGLELFIMVTLTLWCSCALGLLLSSLVRSNDQAMPALVLAIMIQLVFCGGLIEITGRPVLSQLSWLVPSRWGYSGAASTTDLDSMKAEGATIDLQWQHTAGQWWFSVAALVVLGALFILLAARRVRDKRQ